MYFRFLCVEIIVIAIAFQVHSRYILLELKENSLGLNSVDYVENEGGDTNTIAE